MRRPSGASARGFNGTDDEFASVASAIEHVFGLCKTRVRYLEPDVRPGIVADYAVAAATSTVLEANGVSLDEVDLVICGSIARQYFEPATAMEVAAKLGLKQDARLRRDRRLRRPPGGDPDGGRLPDAASALPDRARLYLRAVGATSSATTSRPSATCR